MAEAPLSRFEIDAADIQGIVLFAYRELRSARYCFLRIDDADLARAWLSRVKSEVRSAGPADKDRKRALNLGFTVPGLRALGLSDDVLATFPREMNQGMHDPERALILGDEGPSAPDQWEIGGPSTPPVHVLAMVFAGDTASVERVAAELGLDGCPEGCINEACGGTHRPSHRGDGMSLVGRIDSEKLEGDSEHFGFRDGLAQPYVEGASQRAGGAGAVAAGEFVLGYINEYAQLPLSPSVATGERGAERLPALEHAPEARRDLGKNGTYLVLRKIQQHVGVFWKYLAERATPELDAEALAARIIGRWPDGKPLTKDARRDLEDFDFSDDDEGTFCPRGAHIRRANPRKALPPGPEESDRAVRRHRLLRRGRPYGSPLSNARSGVDDGRDRGLIFIGLNTNVVRQFEFVQQTWMNNVKFGRLHDEEDPLTGQRARGQCTFTIPAHPVRERLTGMPRFVTVRGGGYFFLPSMTALEFLALVP